MSQVPKKESVKKQKNPHYVNNAEFSKAVVEYVKRVKLAKETGENIPIVTNYIATCFLNIAENLSRKYNFIRYTFREEMVMDGVENALRAIENYNIDAATRTGNPNAFAYFTQIIWYAFLRRIAKEKKQQEIKEKYMAQSGAEAFILGEDGEASSHMATHFVDTLKDRINKVKAYDTEIKDFSRNQKTPSAKKKKKAKVVDVDSDLQDFME